MAATSARAIALVGASSSCSSPCRAHEEEVGPAGDFREARVYCRAWSEDRSAARCGHRGRGRRGGVVPPGYGRGGRAAHRPTVRLMPPQGRRREGGIGRRSRSRVASAGPGVLISAHEPHGLDAFDERLIVVDGPVGASVTSIRHPALYGSLATKFASVAVRSSRSSTPFVMPLCRVQTTRWFCATASR
jgi:hypothetical protein